MSHAQRLLVIYGVVILLIGVGLGATLGLLRMNRPPIRTLATAHVETLVQAPIHIGLAYIVGLVGFDSTWATWGAVLFIAGSAMQASGATLNWITNAADQFAERSPGFYLNSASTLPSLGGAAILAAGTLTRI